MSNTEFQDFAYWKAQFAADLQDDDNACSAGQLLTGGWIHPWVGQLYSVMTFKLIITYAWGALGFPGLHQNYTFFFPCPFKFSNLQGQEEHEKKKMHLNEKDLLTSASKHAPADQQLARNHLNLWSFRKGLYVVLPRGWSLCLYPSPRILTLKVRLQTELHAVLDTTISLAVPPFCHQCERAFSSST